VARHFAEQGLAAAREAGDEVSEARGMRFLAVTEQRSGNKDSALDLANRAVALSRRTGVGADLAFALQVVGRLTSDRGEHLVRHRVVEGVRGRFRVLDVQAVRGDRVETDHGAA
jgi:hypothetical protein